MVFENTKICGSKGDKETEGIKGLRNGELHTKYYSGDQIKKNELVKACDSYWERRGACRGLVGKLEWKRTLGTHRSRWEDNIKRIFKN
jgi:hypothetical protein